MCISTVSNHRINRSHCNVEDSQKLYYNSWTQVNKEWPSSATNCSNDFVTIVLKELDVTNVLREITFNYSVKSNYSKVVINESEFDFPNTIWVVRPTWEVALKSSAVAPVVFFGVIVNLILLLLLARCKWLHTSTNLLIGNMALADLCTLVMCPWMLLVNHFYQNYELGHFGCKMEGFITGALLITSVMNIVAISYDRLTAIVLPQEARLSRKAVVRIAIGTWFIGFIFAMPLSIWRYYRERQWLNFLEKYCTENIQILPTYWHVLIFILVWMPLVVLTICYSAIFYRLDKYEQQILRREHPISVRYKTRVARTIFAVLITFVICRTPFTSLIFWRSKLLKEERINAISTSFHVLWFISHFLMYLNCAINPLIYGLTNDNYRKAFVSSSFCKWILGKSDNKEQAANIEKKEKRSPAAKSENKKEQNSFKYHKFWTRGGKMVFTDKSSKSSDKKTPDSPVVSSKITPIPDDFI